MRDFRQSIRLGLKSISQRLLPVAWRFSRIYKKRWWGGGKKQSASGRGSSLEATANIRNELPKVLQAFECGKLMDLGCGDFNWMSLVELGVDYLDADLVPTVIATNNARYRTEGVEFTVLNGTKDPIPDDVDVVLCREVLFHLSFRHALAMLAYIRKSRARLLIATQIGTGRENDDTYTGGFRPLDLTREPFMFPEPLESIADDAISSERALAVWWIDDMPVA